MQVEVRIPTLGESVTEGVIVRWLKADGDAVRADDPLLELETDKANVEIPSPGAGVIQRLKEEGATVQVGEVVARIETGAKMTTAEATRPAATGAARAAATITAAPPRAAAQTMATTSAGAATIESPLSPAVRRLVTEHGLNPRGISGTGRGGRLTKADVLAYLDTTSAEQEAVASAPPRVAAAPSPADRTPPARPEAQTAPLPVPQGADRSTPAAADDDEERIPMTRLRQRIAERLVQAQRAAAILTTFNEVDMSAVMDVRGRFKARFAEVHGVSLGFMSFFAQACIRALQDVPIVNAQIDGTEIVHHKHVHLGVAVATERGLVVPIIHRADQLSFAEIEREIERLARAARENKLSIEDLSRGTFTISNGGVFGSLLSTPILNPPQSAILGMHKIEKRPVVIDDQIVVRPMMYLCLLYTSPSPRDS